MRVTGTIVSGVHRGESLVDKYRYRLIGILGFEPWNGTLNVHVDTPVEVKRYATKRIEHLLVGGIPHVEAHLAHVTLRKGDVVADCWCLCQSEFSETTTLELVAKNNLKETSKLHDGDVVDLEFVDAVIDRRDMGKKLFDRIASRRRQ